MTGFGVVALLLLGANVSLPALSGQRVVTRERHVFDREDEVTIAVPAGSRGWKVRIQFEKTGEDVVPSVEDRTSSKLLRFKLPVFAYGIGELLLHDGAVLKKRWPITVSSPSDESPELHAAILLRGKDKYSEAIEKIDEIISSEPAIDILTWAEVERGHIAFLSGDRATAEIWWLRGARSAEKAGMIGEAHARLLGVTFLRHQRGDYSGAEESLAEAQKYIGLVEDPFREVANRYHQGVLRFFRGEYVASARILKDVIADAWAIGNERAYLDAVTIYAIAKNRLGAFRQAAAAFDHIKEAGANPLMGSFLRSNRGEQRLMMMEAGAIARDYDAIRADYDGALKYLEKNGTPQRIAHLRLRRAELALYEDDVSAAEEELRSLSKFTEDERDNVRWEEPFIRAELALRWKRFDEAEARMQALMQAIAASPEGSIPRAAERSAAAMVLQAEISQARGRTDEAIARYRAALEAIESLAVRLELPRGRGSYLFKGPRAVESLAALYIQEEKVDEAFALLASLQSGPLEDLRIAARIDQHGAAWREYQLSREQLATARKKGCATARPSERKTCNDGLRELETKADAALQSFFNVSGAQIPKRPVGAKLIAQINGALGKDELLVAAFRLGEAWILFRVDRRGLKYERMEALSQRWPAGLKKAGHVYWLLGDRTDALQEQLFDELTPEVSMSRLASIDGLFHSGLRPDGQALVVADGDGTLPMVRALGRAMSALLGGASYLVGEQATRAAVIAALTGRSVFHFIGHASLDDDPWSTELHLARGESLSVGDLVAARPALGLAVLEGCSTGAPAFGGELGFPQVMISSGAHSVLATVRDLKPGEATAFLTRFYDAGGAERPADAFRRAVAASKKEKDESWRAFRLWGRR